MRSTRNMVIAAILACSVAAYGASVVVYTVETGGNNNAAAWEANTTPVPAYVSGVTDGSTVVTQGNDLNWAVRVSVGGVHSGNPGDGLPTLGAANLVFDLVVLEADGVTPVNLGAAPMSCVAGTPGTAGASDCKPTDKGFWSSINDGDEDGIRGSVARDKWANAALARSIHNQASAPSQLLTLDSDAANSQGVRLANPGPNFDYGWYPTANGRGGLDLDGTKAVDTSVNKTELAGMLVGFGVGYKNYNYTYYTPGVGQYWVDYGVELGFGADVGDPLSPTNPERPLFEGQLSTKNLPAGTYYLKVLPSANGNNILHGNVVWDDPNGDYNGSGSFAAKANSAVALPAQASGVKFVVDAPIAVPTVVGRKIFYNNSYYDGNKIGVDPAPGAGARDDDADAIDPSKSPLMAGGGTATFANWTGYAQGINGLIYDVQDPTRTPVAGDFTFRNVGKAGTTSPGALVTPNAFVAYQLSATPNVVRCVMTFASTGGSTPSGTVQDCWLKVDIGTGFGAAAETHYWGNARMDGGTVSGVNILVTAQDELDARNNPHTIANRALVNDAYDYNKDSLVSSADQILARNNKTTIANCVKIITK